MNKTALILGATGLTGSHLLDYLLTDTDYSKIIVLSRSTIEKVHPKIVEYVIDFDELDNYSELFQVDDVFCCIGTTRSKSPDKSVYRSIDYGIPVKAAQLASLSHVRKMIVVSAPGANPTSSIFYNRTKGEMQRDVLTYEVEGGIDFYFLQPSLIVGERKEKRSAESVASKVMKLLDWMIPANYKRIDAKVIAKAMLYIAKYGYPSTIVSSKEIRELATK